MTEAQKITQLREQLIGAMQSLFLCSGALQTNGLEKMADQVREQAIVINEILFTSEDATQ